MKPSLVDLCFGTPERRAAFARSTAQWLATPLRQSLTPVLHKYITDPLWVEKFNQEMLAAYGAKRPAPRLQA